MPEFTFECSRVVLWALREPQERRLRGLAVTSEAIQASGQPGLVSTKKNKQKRLSLWIVAINRKLQYLQSGFLP